MATDNAISMAELANRIESLDSLKKAVSTWETADVDTKLFQGCLGLKPGVNADNTSSLSILHNTLTVATCVDQQLTNEDIRQRIYDQPAASTFHALAALSGQLRTAVERQTARYEAFAQLVGLESSDWMYQSGDALDELI